ncbi:UNVERIFIED_CONTAM: hypothetical protein NY603_18365, partial [Bacteroidetes bacterium 56_B9]
EERVEVEVGVTGLTVTVVEDERGGRVDLVVVVVSSPADFHQYLRMQDLYSSELTVVSVARLRIVLSLVLRFRKPKVGASSIATSKAELLPREQVIDDRSIVENASSRLQWRVDDVAKIYEIL